MSELHDFEINQEEAPEVSEAFVVDNDAKADWALRKLSVIRKKMQENAALAAAEQERTTRWLEFVNEKLQRDAGYFETLLGGYAGRERAESNRKTVELPHGKIKTRSTKPKAVITDEAEFLAWARENEPSLIRVKESPNISAVNEFIDGEVVVTKQGEIIPAVQVVPESVNYTIETE